MIAKGISMEKFALDFLLKSGSSSGGRTHSYHCHSRELNIFPSFTPTASQCLPAVGTAWGQKIEAQGAITVCSIGDGSIRQGEFYEAVCFAIEKMLPIIFIIEDNGYAISTKTEGMNPFKLEIFNHKIVTYVDGLDVFQVQDASRIAMDKARSNNGPSILWCKVERINSHTAGDDQRIYRTKKELDGLKDPISIFTKKLIRLELLTAEYFTELELWATNYISNIYKIAEQAPEIDIEVTSPYTYLFSPSVTKYESPKLNNENNITMVEAINKALDLGLSTNPKLILFGEDIEDPKGGVFGFTKGLSTKYKQRVINSPLAEATIVGVATGLATLGFKPIFEIQFIDYILPAFNQLVANVASLSWRSCGQWKAPVVLYAPYGAYLPSGGAWHSQSNDSWWATIPGLKVAIPSTAQDAFDMFLAAFQDENPSLILIPKHIFRRIESIINRNIIPFGKATLIQSGKDVTVVSWGNCISIAQEAANILALQGISIEIVDVRTLVPCDLMFIKKSILKTKRLVVIHEDSKTCGFGANIVSELLCDADCFNKLYSSPQVVAGANSYIAAHPKLEYQSLPDVKKVIQAIRLTL